jgi:RNA polymerase sigma-B factor
MIERDHINRFQGARTTDSPAAWQHRDDPRVREQLTIRYLPFAKRLARRYRGACEPVEDLEQVASMALVKAIDRYEPERGISFHSFAVPTILGELKRYFRDCGWSVHMPRGIQDLAIKVERASRTLTAKSGHAPTVNELAEYLELSIEDVLDAIEAAAAHHSISLETPRDDGEGHSATLGDTLGQEDERFEMVDLSASIAQAAAHLPKREREVLALKFAGDQVQTQIAARIGVSQMQVSRIMRRALDRLAAAIDVEN